MARPKKTEKTVSSEIGKVLALRLKGMPDEKIADNLGKSLSWVKARTQLNRNLPGYGKLRQEQKRIQDKVLPKRDAARVRFLAAEYGRLAADRNKGFAPKVLRELDVTGSPAQKRVRTWLLNLGNAIQSYNSPADESAWRSAARLHLDAQFRQFKPRKNLRFPPISWLYNDIAFQVAERHRVFLGRTRTSEPSGAERAEATSRDERLRRIRAEWKDVARQVELTGAGWRELDMMLDSIGETVPMDAEGEPFWLSVMAVCKNLCACVEVRATDATCVEDDKRLAYLWSRTPTREREWYTREGKRATRDVGLAGMLREIARYYDGEREYDESEDVIERERSMYGMTRAEIKEAAKEIDKLPDPFDRPPRMVERMRGTRGSPPTPDEMREYYRDQVAKEAAASDPLTNAIAEYMMVLAENADAYLAGNMMKTRPLEYIRLQDLNDEIQDRWQRRLDSEEHDAGNRICNEMAESGRSLPANLWAAEFRSRMDEWRRKREVKNV